MISDKAGNIGSQEVLFNVDLTPPIINIISPSATGFNSSVGLIYSITEDHIKTTKIFLNGISNTSIRQSGYNYSLAEGSYNITLIVTDLAGNNASQTVLFYIDMEKPNILLINPTTGIYQKPNSIINISVTDDHSLLKVEYKWDTADKFSSFVLSNGSYISLLINSDGNHTITIFATDVAGNIALMSFSFITDGTAPEIVLLSPENSAILHTDTLINISITDNFAVEKALFNWDGTENSTFSPPYSINLVAINGTHRLNVFAEDLAGNWISQSYLFTIILPSSASLLTESIIIVAGIVIVGGTGLIGVTFTVLRRRHQKEVNDNIDKLLDSYGKSDKSKKS